MLDTAVEIEALRRALADIIGFAAGMHEDLYGGWDGMEHHRALLGKSPDPEGFLLHVRSTSTDAEAFEVAMRGRRSAYE